MHKRFYNQARLDFVLEPRGPVLVKSGIETPDPTRPDMEFVRTRVPDLGETIYLPGTSLKGTLRSQAERSLAGLGVTICDPFGGPRDAKKSCHFQIHGQSATTARFASHCPACRTFGSLSIAGRLNVTDALPRQSDDQAAEARTETRMQVGIDRQNGGASGGTLFDLEVAIRGRFHARLHLKNFELWQLGLVAAVLGDIDDGLVPVGFGKSRGLGQMSVALESLVIDTAPAEDDDLLGVSALGGDDVRAYAPKTDAATDRIDVEGLGSEGLRKTWRGSRLELSDAEAIGRVFDRAIEGPLTTLTREHGRRGAAG